MLFTLNIWPWRQKSVIPVPYVFAYGHYAHTYAILASSDEKCGRSPRKCEKSAKKRYLPLRPWPWSNDLGTHMVCWPCLGLPTMWIWSSYLIIKGVKGYIIGFTFDLEYLTLKAKIRYSGSLRFCIWSFCTYLCNLSFIGWEMWEESAKMWKIG